MAIWLLERIEELPDNEEENPWDPRYDKADGFVVRAESEHTARLVAAAHALEEERRAWLESKFSTCVRVDEDGECDMIMMSAHDA